jgi:hypothetical protein
MKSVTLTISMEEYQALIEGRNKAEREAAEANAQAIAARMSDPTATVEKVTAFARQCLTVVNYAVANLPPEVNKGWPYEALTRVCEMMNVLPDFGPNDRDMAIDMLNFANDAKTLELRRKGEAKPPTKFTPEELAQERARLEQSAVGATLLKNMGA